MRGFGKVSQRWLTGSPPPRWLPLAASTADRTLCGMTAIGQPVTVLDNFDQAHDAILVLSTQPRGPHDEYTWHGQLIGVEGDQVLKRIKLASLESGCTMLTKDPDGRFEVTLTDAPAGGFTAQGIGPVPFAD